MEKMETLSRGGIALAQTIRDLYREGQTDYSMEPIVLAGADGEAVGRIRDGDAVIFCCRRGEREIQLTEAFVDPDFDHFPRKQFQELTFVIMTLYHEKFKRIPVAFAPARIGDTLGEILGRRHLQQLRVAESEKFAHVTFFFNGGVSQPFPGEDDLQVPSPKGVLMEQAPELSVAGVADEVLRGIEKRYDLIVANFANGDVIGHLPSREARIRCAEAVDRHLGRVITAAQRVDYVSLITADHGILEEMDRGDGTLNVAHTTHPVPSLLVDPRGSRTPLRKGRLADIAPTILQALGVPQPEAMTGQSLAPDHVWNGPRRVLLLILDGWGLGPEDETNPIFCARTPVWDRLMRDYPASELEASGEAVGLRPGKAGNSEAGHMNIGAGRVVVQDDVRLDQALQEGAFAKNRVFLQAIDGVLQRGKALHLLTLLSERSSHGTVEYPLALLRMAKSRGLTKAFVHLILDGRSTEPGSAPVLLARLEKEVEAIGLGRIVSGVGRGLALDRDGNYAKTRKAYDALVFGVGRRAGMG
jgi:2,3-bisphosphoglycerate-independent phosphoglycerate mutase